MKLESVKKQENNVKRSLKATEGIRLLFAVLVVGFLYFVAYLASYTPPLLFMFSIVLVYFSAFPKWLYSPRNILFGYYFMWYTFPVMGATRYQNLTFTSEEEVISYILLITSYVVGYIALYFMENCNLASIYSMFRVKDDPSNNNSDKEILIPVLIAVVASFMLVYTTGGLAKWMEDPGMAFMTRAGAGVYTVLLDLSLSYGAIATGYRGYVKRNYWYFILYSLFLIVLSPVIGGKYKLLLMLILLFLPLSFFYKTSIKNVTIFVLVFLFVFGLGIWLRNLSWLTLKDAIPYSLNYFSTFEMLVISVRDFDPDLFRTVLLPFNKFLSPIGISDPNLFFDASSWLTSIYFPDVWALRCTDQWPIETDLYLSFYYVLGIPFLCAYFGILGSLFNIALHTRNLGIIFLSTNMCLAMVSHLRGSLISWSDFYTIPFLLLACWLLRKYYISKTYA